MKKLLALAFAATIGAVASAQYGSTNDNTLTNLSLRLGGSLPLDSKLGDLYDGFLNIGLDYHLPNAIVRGAGESYLSFDWFTGNSKFSDNVFPIMINQRWNLNPMGGRNTWWSLGVGAVIADLDKSETSFGLRAALGTELGENIFTEAVLHLSDRTGNSRFNVLGIHVGYRF